MDSYQLCTILSTPLQQLYPLGTRQAASYFWKNSHNFGLLISDTMLVHMPMLHPLKTFRDQTWQRSSQPQYPYRQSLAIALVMGARKTFNSICVCGSAEVQIAQS